MENIIINSDNNVDITLKYDNWNDFGYVTTCEVLYNNQRLGYTKLYSKKLESVEVFPKRIFDILEDDYKNNGSVVLKSEDYCSLGTSTSFYKHIWEMSGKKLDSAEKILNTLKDIVILDKESLDDFSKYTGFNDSLLRENESKFIYELVQCLSTRNNKLNYFFDIMDPNNENINKIYKENKEKDKNLINVMIMNENVDNIIVDIFLKSNESPDDTDKKFLAKIKDENSSKLDLVTSIDKLLSDAIASLILTIKNELTISSPDQSLVLGHYSTIQNVATFFSKSKSYLRLTNSQQLNDPMEGKILFSAMVSAMAGDEQEQGACFKPKEHQQSPVYISAATTETDSLPMWKQYSGDATGAVFIYDSNFLKHILEDTKAVKLYRVCYIKPSKNKIEVKVSGYEQGNKELDCITKNINDLAAEMKDAKSADINLLNVISYLFKDMAYAYEQEYRLILNQDENKDYKVFACENGESPVPFLYTLIKDESKKADFSIKYQKVILGPKCIDIDYIAPYIKYIDPKVVVEQSNISYR